MRLRCKSGAADSRAGGLEVFVIGKYKAFSEILSCLTMLLGIEAGTNCGESKRLLNLL